MCYFGTLFSQTEEVVDTVVHHLQNPRLGQVDCVVGIGLSGTMPLVPVRQKSGINIRAIRKQGVESHSGVSAASEYADSGRYVILDDFVESGSTLTALRAKMAEVFPRWECAGVILYSQYSTCDTFLDVPILGVAEEVQDLHKLRHPPEPKVRKPMCMMSGD